MHRSKLFRALVIGGGMTAAALVGCGDETTAQVEQSADQQSESTAGDSTPDDSTPDDSTPDDSTPDDSTPDDSTPDDSTPDDSTPDDSTPDDSTPDESDAATDDPLSPCFCDSTVDCCEEVDGEQQAAEGFECCWGTSC